MSRVDQGLRQLKRNAKVELARLAQHTRFRKWSTRELPMIFGNALPKCGSHMLFSFLRALPKAAPFVLRYPGAVRTLTPAGRHRTTDEILEDLSRMRSGDIALGYLRATQENVKAFGSPQMRAFFLYRDPRDRIVSHIIFATDMHTGHRMRAYYLDLPSMEERIAATIRGVSEEQFFLPSILKDYTRQLPWLDHPNVMPFKFEELIHERNHTLHRMLDHIESAGYEIPMAREEAIPMFNAAMAPEHSQTFRSGKSGTWSEHFSEENKELFKDVAGPLLLELGYETSNDW